MRNYLDIINQRFENVLKNIENLFLYIPDNLYNKKSGGYPVWRQLYHMLNSLERNFIDPVNYKFPDFHEDRLNSLDSDSGKVLDKDLLKNYFKNIKKKISEYIKELNDEKLLETVKFKDMELTRFDFILSQFIHVMWHAGFLCSCMKAETGSCPEYKGLYKN